jgi:hypothetical protein
MYPAAGDTVMDCSLYVCPQLATKMHMKPTQSPVNTRRAILSLLTGMMRNLRNIKSAIQANSGCPLDTLVSERLGTPNTYEGYY